MPIALKNFVNTIRPDKTILLFGAGASIPSGAPSVPSLIEHLAQHFKQDKRQFTLSEFTELLDKRIGNRREIIEEIRKLYSGIRPTGGILNLPLYDWKSIYTTNYDELVEICYDKKHKPLQVYSSNYDFSGDTITGATKLFKLHGTLKKDICDGHKERLILTVTDYENMEDYRQFLFDRLRTDISEGSLVIIGHSLADPDIREIVDTAIRLKKEIGSNKQITLLMYTKDNDLAELMELRGLNVVFGGLDDFFAELSQHEPLYKIVETYTGSPLEAFPSLPPLTLDVAHFLGHATPNISSMYNGSSATYADIANGLTFQRTKTNQIYNSLIDENIIAAVILGASGVGKTTAARQVALKLQQDGYLIWEHKPDQPNGCSRAS